MGSWISVSTVCLDEEAARKYIRKQEQEDGRLEQLNPSYQEKPLPLPAGT